jgi:DNA repair protein RadC
MIIRERMRGATSNPGDVYAVIKSILNKESVVDREKEHFWTLGLNADNRIKYIDLVCLGGLSQASICMREIFRLAVKKGVASIIVAHNHPSGCTRFSPEDIRLTNNLFDAGRLLGISVLDHVLIGTRCYASYAVNGRRLQQSPPVHVPNQNKKHGFLKLYDIDAQIKSCESKLRKYCERKGIDYDTV